MSWNCKCKPLVFKCFPDTSVEGLRARGCSGGPGSLWTSSSLWTFVNEVELDASCEVVFACFADGMQWPLWFPGLRGVRWTGDSKRVGATRTVYFDSFSSNQYFLVWEEGVQLTFRLDSMSRPVYEGAIEDYKLTNLGNGKCKLTHTVLLKPRYYYRREFFRARADRMYKDASVGLKDYVHKSYGDANIV